MRDRRTHEVRVRTIRRAIHDYEASNVTLCDKLDEKSDTEK